MNALMVRKEVSDQIPEIRSVGADAMAAEYATTQGAIDSIRLTIQQYYQENYPEQVNEFKPLLDSAITAIIDEYQINFFPEMKVRWSEYPNNITHLNSPGCFRCHDGKHVDEEGNAISRDCSSCHEILAQGSDKGPITYTEGGLQFRHPVDIDEAWKEMLCSDCHTGE
jgi:hypothetical protein